MSETFEATVPSVLTLCRDGSSGIAVCLDRRVSARVTAREPAAPPAMDPQQSEHLGAAIAAGLHSEGVAGDWEVSVQGREQGAPGLHRAGPLTLAALAAIRRASGLASDIGSVLQHARAMRWKHVSRWERLMGFCAARGGVVHMWDEVPAPAPVDPAWIEERISLFDLTPLNLMLAPAAPKSGALAGDTMIEALAGRDHDRLGAFVDRDRERSWPADETVQPVLDLAAAAGAAFTFRGKAPSLLLVLWHRPGQGPRDPATPLKAGLRALGARSIMTRFDLLGLDQE